MAAEKDANKPKMPVSTREMIYGVVLVVGFVSIVSGVNGMFAWGLSETVSSAIGVALGVAAAFGLSWLRKR
jgi:hypothetical protein